MSGANGIHLQLMCRGVRGATVAGANSREAILEATRELLWAMSWANHIRPDDIASVYFTTTIDLNATYPAGAIRQMGWSDVAMLCSHEIDVPGGLPRCIRVLLHWNTYRRPDEIVHVYLHEAKRLRPDRPPITLPHYPAGTPDMLETHYQPLS